MRRLLLVAAVSCMAALILFKAVATAHSGGTDSEGGLPPHKAIKEKHG